MLTTRYSFSIDGKAITLFDSNYDKWSVTWDRSTGLIIDAKAKPGRRADEVQFSPNRLYIVVGGYGITIYAVADGNNHDAGYWAPYDFIAAGKYTWRFVDVSTIELTYQKGGKHRLYDLDAKAFK